METIKELFQTDYVKYGLIIVGTLVAAFILSKILRALFTKFLQLASSKLNVDPTHYSFLNNLISFVIYFGAFIFIFYTIPGLRALPLSSSPHNRLSPTSSTASLL